MKHIITFIIFGLLHTLSYGAEPFLWRQSPGSAPIIFPKKDGQTRQEAIEEYFKKIQETKSLQGLFEESEIQDLIREGKLTHERGIFKSLEPAINDKPRFVVVTNELDALYKPPHGNGVANVIKRLEAMGAEVFVLPVVHDLTLDAKESKEFREKLISLFDAQLILGGDDIDPYLYGEKKSYARNIVRKRDVSELKFVRQFIEAKQGMNFGICRGHQMCAVANHKKLTQDIQIEEHASEIHLNGHHLINIDDSSEVFSAFDKDKLLVNSFHHQAVFVHEGDSVYKIIGSSLDNQPIVEALEFLNGLGFTFQFHPELMHDENGDKILRQFIKLTIKNKILRKLHIGCADLMKAFFD